MASINALINDGVDGTADSGTQLQFVISGNWLAGDSWSIIISDTSGSVTVGMGTIFKQVPASAITLANRVYFVAGSFLFFSAIGDPTAWDPQDVGSGFIQITSRSASTENLVGLASYQGRLAVFSPRTTQIWTTDADPTKFALNQVLDNIGSLAAEAIKSYGDMDVFFGSNTGVRSLRVRDSSLNAFVSDIGSPVDQLIQASIAQANASGNMICGIVEPTANRYWLFVQDTIYVLSYFPASKVAAWSTYKPTVQVGANQVPFVPVKFCVSNLQVWVRAVDGSVYLYGGLNGTTFDNCTTRIETPWLDVKKPGTFKASSGVDMSVIGKWLMSATMDYLSNGAPRYVPLISATKPTFARERIPFSERGTHIKFQLLNAENRPATFSMLMWHYKEENEK